jgi:tetratricopeptide (TPR) repeat protein
LPAHPELGTALERINAALSARPSDAALYVDRGELYANYKDWVAAEANYLRAAELSPHLPRLARARGRLALATGQLQEALEHLSHALRFNAHDAEAWIYRSRAHAALHARARALADLERAIALISNPRPELFLERASLHDEPVAAIRSLDSAMARIGPAHTLQLRALELEESTGLTDAAVARLARLAAESERKDLWLKRQGDVLARAGRHAEARSAYTAALEYARGLPDWLRQSPETRRLIAELSPSNL